MKTLRASLLSLLLVCSLLFALAACGGDPVTQTTTTQPAATTEVPATTNDDSTTALAEDSTTTPAEDTTAAPAEESTTVPAQEDPDEEPEPPAEQPTLSVGDAARVKSTATHFSPRSRSVRMRPYVPGGTYTVYQLSADQALLGLDGVYTGWVYLADLEGFENGDRPSPPPEDEEPITTPPSTTRPPATAVPSTTRPPTTTRPPATTKPAPTVNAPVGGTVSQIVAFYNQYANATKAYSGRVRVSKTDGTVTTINSVTGGSLVKNLLEEKLPQDYTAKPDKTFNNGRASDGTTLVNYLPRSGQAKMSVLEPAGVASASCVKRGSGWRVTIVLKTETVSGNGIAGVNAVPKYASQCMDTLDLKASDLEPATVRSATVKYENCKIVADINGQGRITALEIDTPAEVSGSVRVSVINANIVLTGLYRGRYVFTY